MVNSEHSTESPINPPDHPGVCLKTVLAKQHLTPSAFAMTINIYPNVITDIIRGKRKISVTLALELEKALGIEAEIWLVRQLRWDLYMARLKPNAEDPLTPKHKLQCTKSLSEES